MPEQLGLQSYPLLRSRGAILRGDGSLGGFLPREPTVPADHPRSMDTGLSHLAEKLTSSDPPRGAPPGRDLACPQPERVCHDSPNSQEAPGGRMGGGRVRSVREDGGPAPEEPRQWNA